MLLSVHDAAMDGVDDGVVVMASVMLLLGGCVVVCMTPDGVLVWVVVLTGGDSVMGVAGFVVKISVVLLLDCCVLVGMALSGVLVWAVVLAGGGIVTTAGGIVVRTSVVLLVVLLLAWR